MSRAQKAAEWLEARAGVVKLGRSLLFTSIPGGPRWRYGWGAALLFSFAIQAITGFFLLTFYSASAQTAWESVFYLQTTVPFGGFLRALHHYNAQLLPLLIVGHLAQMIIHRSLTAPRELNFWLLAALFPLVVALSVTGWLLPYDQKGYWAARVPVNLLGLTPLVGPPLKQLLLGGPDFGHHTLTRFLALHAFMLPALALGILLGKSGLERRHRAAETAAANGAPYWPDQFLRDAVVCLAVMGALLAMILRPWLTGETERVEVPLYAPADPAQPFPAARPEWPFLFLFQFLKYFPGGAEVLGAIGAPLVLLALILAMPWIARRPWGHRFNVAAVALGLSGAGALTWLAIRQDQQDPQFPRAVREARAQAQRVQTLARRAGIPPAGAVELLRRDPLSEGPRLFARHCASCHRYGGHDGLGQIPEEPPSAPDLKGFASRAWIAGILDPERVSSPAYFGGTSHAQGQMAKFVRKTFADAEPDLLAQRAKVIKALSAEAGLPAQREADRKEAADILEGRRLLAGEDMRCTECHQFRQPDETATAPDLTGYGTRAWLIGIISDPAHPRYYGGRNDRMPAFGRDQILSAQAIELLADWLRGDGAPESSLK